MVLQIEINKQVTSHLDIGEKCLDVFFYLFKDFSTVPHDMLFGVLVKGVVLAVFRRYLCNTNQILRFGDITSDPHIIKICVPQGTVLRIKANLKYR